MSGRARLRVVIRSERMAEADSGEVRYLEGGRKEGVGRFRFSASRVRGGRTATERRREGLN